MNDFVKSAYRVLDMLELFAVTAKPLGVSHVAREMGIPKSSAQALLTTLALRGYLAREAAAYQLAPGLRSGGGWVGGPLARLVHIAAPLMRAIADASGESAFLSVMTRDSRLKYVGKAVSANEVRYDAALTHTRPAYSTSSGLVILAHRPVAEVDAFFRQVVLEPITPNTITDRKELQRLLAKTKRDGFAQLRDTHVLGASGVSAPVLSRDGLAIAALTLAAPTWRYAKVRARMIEQVRAGAAELTRAMTPWALPVEQAAA